MTRGLFLNVPMTGHVNPTLELVNSLTASGHQIDYYCTPSFASKIERSGATFHPYRVPISDINPGKKPSGIELVTHFLGSSLRIIDAHIHEWRQQNYSYVIHDSCLFAGNILSKQLGIPGITSTTTFGINQAILKELANPLDFLKSFIFEPHLWFYWSRVKKRIKREFNLEVSLLDSLTCPQKLNLTYTSSHFQPKAETFDPSVHKFIGPMLKIREQHDDFPFAELEGKKVIYISLGTVYNKKPEFFENCVRAFTGMSDTMVVMTIGDHIDPQSLKADPKQFIIRSQVPQLALLPKVDLFICHGGMNSINEAMFFNVPVLICPQQNEQNLVATRVEQLGAGINAKKSYLESHMLRSLAESMLAKRELYKEAAKKIGDSFQTTVGAEGGVDLIQKYIASSV